MADHIGHLAGGHLNLDEVLLGTQGQCLLDNRGLAVVGKHHHRNVTGRAVGCEPCKYLHSIEVRHPDVEDDQVRVARRRQPEPCLTIRSHQHVIAGPLEGHLVHHRDDRIVVDQQDDRWIWRLHSRNIPGVGRIGRIFVRKLSWANYLSSGLSALMPSNVETTDKTSMPLKETPGALEGSKHTYDDVVNRLSHELGSPIAVLRGYFSFWLDGSLDPVPWSTREDVEGAAAQVEGLAKQAVALVDIFSRSSAGANRHALDSWPADAYRRLAGPVHELRAWFRAKDRATLKQLSTESHTAVLICERSAIVLEALVRQIATAHIVTGNEMPEMESIDLSNWLRRSVHELAPSVTCFGHPFSLDFPSSPVPIQGNSTLLAVALLNLLDNAQKFSHPRSPIQVVGYERAGVCGFAVEDGGPGLPRDFEFRAFGRIDHGPGFAAPGMGLGLFTAKRVAELHGGSLTIRAIEHRGTRVGIQLPASGGVKR